jgi:hypothetical protein
MFFRCLRDVLASQGLRAQIGPGVNQFTDKGISIATGEWWHVQRYHLLDFPLVTAENRLDFKRCLPAISYRGMSRG